MFKNANIKISTNNSLENFNRRFKKLFLNKNKTESINYVDNLISIALDNKDFYISEINKNSKIISKNKLNLINKENAKDISYDEQSVIISEIESSEDLLTEINDSNKIYISNIDKKNNGNNLINNNEIGNQFSCIIKTELNNHKFLIWKDNSCSLDSFLCIFLYCINPLLELKENLNLYNDEKNNNNIFELFLKFIDFINSKHFNEENIYFYDTYEHFNKINKCNLCNFNKEIEYKKFLPIVINYRLFINIKLFTIRYTVNYYCTGKCKFKHKLLEEKTSPPFIDIPNTPFSDHSIKNADDLFKKQIYFNLNTLCNEKECIDNVNFYIKTFNILDLPLILSFNINVLNFSELSSTKYFINNILTNNIIIYNTNYQLISFVAQPSEDHYVCYFENNNIIYTDSINNWYRYDDTTVVIIKLNNIIF